MSSALNADSSKTVETPIPQAWPARTLRAKNPKLLALIMVTLVSTLQGIDPSLHAVAMPHVAGEFGLDPSMQSFMTSIGTIILAASMLGVGIIGDLRGRKLILVLGGFGMALSAVISAIAPGVAVFGIGRVLMGVCTAMSFAMCLAFVPTLFTNKELPKAFSIWLAVQSAAVVLATVIGGAILDAFGWRGTYAVMILVAVIFSGLAILYVPENKAAQARRFDVVGVLLAAVALVALVYSLSQASTQGWTSPIVLGGTGLAVVLLVVFVLWESRVKDPAFPVKLFTIPAFAAACIVGVLFNFANASMGGQAPALLKSIGVLDQSLATTALTVSILLATIGIGCFIGSIVSGWAQAKFAISPRAMFISGLISLAVGLGSQFFVTTDNRILVIGIGMFIVGFGIMWTQNPQSAVIMGSAPKEMVGAVGAVKPAVGQLGAGLGFGVTMPLASLFFSPGQQLVDIPAYGKGMALEAAIFIVAAIAVFFLLRSKKTKSAIES